MRHLGGRNGFLMEGVRALSSGGLLPGATEHKEDGHLLLGAAWYELGVNGFRGAGIGSVFHHAGEGIGSPDDNLLAERVDWRGGEWSGMWLGFKPEVRIGSILCGVRWTSVGRIRCGGRARARPGVPISAPYLGWIWGVSVSPSVWGGYEEAGYVAFLHLDTDWAARLDVWGRYGGPIVDALSLLRLMSLLSSFQ